MDSLEIEGFRILASHSASDNRGPRRIGRVRKTDTVTAILMIHVGPVSVSSDASPTLSLTSIRMKI